MQSRRNCLGNPGPRWRTGEAGRTAEVKLEAQVLVTAGGVQRLSLFPFEDDLIV